MSTFRDLKRIRIGFGPRSYDLFTISNIAKDKSFVDDLNKERGIVSMRVGFVLRSTEIKPLFQDLSNQIEIEHFSIMFFFHLKVTLNISLLSETTGVAFYFTLRHSFPFDLIGFLFWIKWIELEKGWN